MPILTTPKPSRQAIIPFLKRSSSRRLPTLVGSEDTETSAPDSCNFAQASFCRKGVPDLHCFPWKMCVSCMIHPLCLLPGRRKFVSVILHRNKIDMNLTKKFDIYIFSTAFKTFLVLRNSIKLAQFKKFPTVKSQMKNKRCWWKSAATEKSYFVCIWGVKRWSYFLEEINFI